MRPDQFGELITELPENLQFLFSWTLCLSRVLKAPVNPLPFF